MNAKRLDCGEGKDMKAKKKPRGRTSKTRIARPGTVSANEDLLIAAIGASAGGIEAFSELIRNLPPDTGMVFVFILHMDPKHHSMLTELLSRETKMKVVEVENEMRVAANQVFVIPPNASMSISDHILQLQPREESRGGHMTIDLFMRALARQRGHRAIGVILSGSGTDGTLGLAEIQAHGGVTFSQDETTAKHDGMPRSVIAAGCVDYVLPPKRIAYELARIARHPYVATRQLPEEIEPGQTESAALNIIFQLLRRGTGVDFTHYRQTTILRRIRRRMVVHNIDLLEEYVKYMQVNPAEVKALYQDVLISVTSFFRNPRVFEALKKKVFPGVLKDPTPNRVIRIWTPACASGEETYSIAIALLDFLGDKAAQHAIQIFGTDVSEANIVKAREGMYPANIQGDISAERLRRYFTAADGGYRISKTVRDLCIFAQHNVLNDPPFSQMNLICCRNLLIFLEPVLQNKLIALFHYASRPGGYLVLGTSEGLGTSTNLFESEDRVLRIFTKKSTAVRPPVTFAVDRQGQRFGYKAGKLAARAPETNWDYLEGQREFDRRLLSQHAPAAILVNEDLEIIHSRGNVTRYLKLSPGRASLNILKMAREGLLMDLRNAIGRAKKDKVPVSKHNVRIREGNGTGGKRGGDSTRSVNLEVTPMDVGGLREGYYMIVFQDAPQKAKQGPRAAAGKASEGAAKRISKLEQELSTTKEYLESVIESQEATNEELQSANEEILSSNEELQSMNEELETAKEELQSTNEELNTVNDELRDRNLEISHVNADLSSLIASIGIAVVLVGSDLTIRRITPQAQKLLGLIPADVGRPLSNINPAIEIPDFQQMVTQVTAQARPLEKEVADRKGTNYLLRILPYEIEQGRIDGTVITLVEIPTRASAARAETSS
jgi:two-component system CheB/CheR fusion protein